MSSEELIELAFKRIGDAPEALPFPAAEGRRVLGWLRLLLHGEYEAWMGEVADSLEGQPDLVAALRERVAELRERRIEALGRLVRPYNPEVTREELAVAIDGNTRLFLAGSAE